MDLLILYGILFGILMLVEWIWPVEYNMVVALSIIVAILSVIMIHTEIKNKPLRKKKKELEAEAERLHTAWENERDIKKKNKIFDEYWALDVQVRELEKEIEKIK